jgi:hypothetical protein
MFQIQGRWESEDEGSGQFVVITRKYHIGHSKHVKIRQRRSRIGEDIRVNESFDCGYFFVLSQIMKKLWIDVNTVLDKVLPARVATHVKAMIAGTIITGGSKLSIYNRLERESHCSGSLGVENGDLKVDDLYGSPGVLSHYQKNIEKKWFRYHKGSAHRIYLYDLTGRVFKVQFPFSKKQLILRF